MILHSVISPPTPRPEDQESIRLNLSGIVEDDCGCSLGAKCMGIGFVATLVALGLQHGSLGPAFLWRSPLALVVAFVCAGVGKSVGMARARSRRRRESAPSTPCVPNRRSGFDAA